MSSSSSSSSSSARHIRKTFVMGVLPGQEAAYKKSHDEIWPEMSAMLKAHGVHNYSINLHPTTNQLFAYVEIESGERWDAIAMTDVCQRWWAYMKEFVVFGADGKPAATPLTEVFFLP